MKPLTVYIMDADKNELPLATIMDSVGDVVESFVLMTHRNLADNVKSCETDWYMYLFSNEFLSEELTKALPVLMESEFDAWIMFERRKDNKGEYKYGLSPRLFKKEIELVDMLPLLPTKDSIERVLDGFVEQN